MLWLFVLVGWSAAETPRVLRPTSLINQGPAQSFGIAMARPDLDNDGIPDLVVGASTADAKGAIYLYLLDAQSNVRSSQRFSPPTLTNGANFGVSVSFVDLNGDGIVEILVGATGSAGSRGSIFVVFQNQGRVLQSVQLCTGVASADRMGTSVRGFIDLDGDRVPEVLVGGQKKLVIAKLDATASSCRSIFEINFETLNQPANLFNASTNFSCVATADFNRDGRPEVIWGAFSSRSAAVLFLNQAGTALTSVQMLSFENQINTCEPLGDITGDGFPDILFGMSTGFFITTNDGTTIASTKFSSATPGLSIVFPVASSTPSIGRGFGHAVMDAQFMPNGMPGILMGNHVDGIIYLISIGENPTVFPTAVACLTSPFGALVPLGGTFDVTITPSETIVVSSVTCAGLTITPSPPLTTRLAFQNTFVVDGTTTEGVAGCTMTYKDLSDNAGRAVTTQTGCQITIDRTLPRATSVTIAVSGPTPKIARNGNTITVTAVLSEPVTVSTVPPPTIAGAVATTSISGTTVRAVVTVTSSFPEGVVAFSLSLQDAAGNPLTLTAVTDNSPAFIDNSAPTSQICATTTRAPTFAFSEDEIRLELTVSEAVRVTNLICNGVVVTAAVNTVVNTNAVYSLSVVAGVISDGALVCTMSYQDLAGTAGTTLVNSCTMVVDTQPPVATVVTISSNNAQSSLAKAGDTITVLITTNEPVSIGAASPDSQIAATSVRPELVSATQIRATVVATRTMAQGQVGFQIAFQDLAGNRAQVTATTDGTSIRLDTLAPSVDLCLFSNNTKSPRFAKLQDSVFVNLTFLEAADSFSVTCVGQLITSGHPVVANQVVNLLAFTVSRDPLLPITCSVTFQDLSGNPGVQTLRSGCGVTLDLQLPRATASLSSTNSINNTLARVGDTIFLTIVGDESISFVSAVIAGVPIPAPNVATPVTPSLPTTLLISLLVNRTTVREGDVEFSVDVEDKAGNRLNIQSTTDGSAVRAIVNQPEVTLLVLAQGRGQTVVIQNESIVITIAATSEIGEVRLRVNSREVAVTPSGGVFARMFTGIYRVGEREDAGPLRVDVYYTELSTQTRNAVFKPSSAIITMGCEFGSIRNNQTKLCERLLCPPNTTGFPLCRCVERFQGRVDFEPGVGYRPHCTPCESGYRWSVSTNNNVCGVVSEAVSVETVCELVPCPTETITVSDGCQCDASTGHTGRVVFNPSPGEWEANCHECTTCSFVQTLLEECTNTKDTRCASGLQTIIPLIVAVVLWMISVAFVNRLRPGTMSIHDARVVQITALIGFLDVCSDIGFAAVGVSGTLQKLVIFFIVFPGLISTGVFVFTFVSCVRAKSPTSLFRQTLGLAKVVKSHTTIYAISLLLVVLNPRLGPFFLRPLPDSILEKRILKLALLPVFIENIPQIAIQTYFLATNQPGFLVVISLVLSYISVIHEIVSVCLRIGLVGRGLSTWSKKKKSIVAMHARSVTADALKSEVAVSELVVESDEIVRLRAEVKRLERALAREETRNKILRSGTTELDSFVENN